MMKKLPAKIDITKNSNDAVHIRATDQSSGLMMFELEMSLEEFGKGLFSLGARPGVVEIYEKYDTWGLVHECKTERVRVESTHDKKEWINRVNAAVAPLEVDGWQCDEYSKEFNSHKHNYQNKTFAVTMRRYVEPTEETGE